MSDKAKSETKHNLTTTTTTTNEQNASISKVNEPVESRETTRNTKDAASASQMTVGSTEREDMKQEQTEADNLDAAPGKAPDSEQRRVVTQKNMETDFQGKPPRRLFTDAPSSEQDEANAEELDALSPVTMLFDTDNSTASLSIPFSVLAEVFRHGSPSPTKVKVTLSPNKETTGNTGSERKKSVHQTEMEMIVQDIGKSENVASKYCEGVKEESSEPSTFEKVVASPNDTKMPEKSSITKTDQVEEPTQSEASNLNVDKAVCNSDSPTGGTLGSTSYTECDDAKTEQTDIKISGTKPNGIDTPELTHEKSDKNTPGLQNETEPETGHVELDVRTEEKVGNVAHMTTTSDNSSTANEQTEVPKNIDDRTESPAKLAIDESCSSMETNANQEAQIDKQKEKCTANAYKLDDDIALPTETDRVITIALLESSYDLDKSTAEGRTDQEQALADSREPRCSLSESWDDATAQREPNHVGKLNESIPPGADCSPVKTDAKCESFTERSPKTLKPDTNGAVSKADTKHKTATGSPQRAVMSEPTDATGNAKRKILCQIEENDQCTFRIPKFSLQHGDWNGENVRKCLLSRFPEENVTNKQRWCFHIFSTSGDTTSTAYVSILIKPHNLASQKGVKAKYAFSLLDSARHEKVKKTGAHTFTRLSEHRGLSLCMQKDEMDSDDTDLLLSCSVSAQYVEDDTTTVPVDRIVLPVQHSNSELLERFVPLLHSPQFGDITLVCGDHTFRANKHLLAAHSARFQTLIADSKNPARFIEVEAVEPNTLTQILQFLYTSSITNLTTADARRLLEAATRYEMNSLVWSCEQRLIDSLNVGNAVELLIWASRRRPNSGSKDCPQIQSEKLKAAALDFIVSHASEVISDPGWQNLLGYRPLLTEVCASLADIVAFLPPKTPSRDQAQWNAEE